MSGTVTYFLLSSLFISKGLKYKKTGIERHLFMGSSTRKALAKHFLIHHLRECQHLAYSCYFVFGAQYAVDIFMCLQYKTDKKNVHLGKHLFPDIKLPQVHVNLVFIEREG